jgi:phosphohistidine phosphatase
MRRLMLLRHAKTEKDSPSGLDRDRKLDARGRTEAPQIARYMAQQKLLPDVALVSPALRTRETAALLGGELSPRPAVIEVSDLYGADPGDLLRVLHEETPSDAHSALIVAHNPGLHELALTLAAQARDAIDAFPPASLAVFEFTTNEWDMVRPGRGRLTHFVTPRMLAGGAS